MKRLIWANATLISFLVALGCQQTAAPTQGVGSASGGGQNAAERQAAQQPSNEAATSDAGTDRSEQADDPGMTTTHDKTRKQEQPSGDESSRAAPNEGDAEPPR